MGQNYWMFVDSPEILETNRKLGFTLYGVAPRYRRRAERMQPDDRVLFYVNRIRKWVAAATIRSRSFEDHSPVWGNDRAEIFPYRVKLAPDIVLDETDYIDALILAPRLEYVKRWAPEEWPLAFFDRLHLLPQRDFRLIEGEMKRISSGGRGPRRWRESEGRDRRTRHPGRRQEGRRGFQGRSGPQPATIRYQERPPVTEGDEEPAPVADSHPSGQSERPVGGQPDGAVGGQSERPVGGQPDGAVGGHSESPVGGQPESPAADDQTEAPISDVRQVEEPRVERNPEAATEDVPD